MIPTLDPATTIAPVIPAGGDHTFRLPGRYTWEQFTTLQATLTAESRLRMTYLDGVIDLMSVGEQHEALRSLLGVLLALYFVRVGLEFLAVGSATRTSEEAGVSFEPDESYYLGDRAVRHRQTPQPNEHPDLAIEVNFTSGSPQKLEKYRRLAIAEVWMWQDNQLAVYCFEAVSGEYGQGERSSLLPDLDLDLLSRCLQLPSQLQAMRTFQSELALS